MKYLGKRWVHAVGGKAYADGWEATFGKKAKPEKAKRGLCERCDMPCGARTCRCTAECMKAGADCRRCIDGSEPLHDAECPRYWPGGLGKGKPGFGW